MADDHRSAASTAENEEDVPDGASTVSMTPTVADTFHNCSLWCTDSGKIQFYMVFVVSEKTGQPGICDLCNCASSDPSPLPSAHPRDKYKGCRPWGRYKANPKKLHRRIRSKLCLICIQVFKECRLEICLFPYRRIVLLVMCVGRVLLMVMVLLLDK